MVPGIDHRLLMASVDTPGLGISGQAVTRDNEVQLQVPETAAAGELAVYFEFSSGGEPAHPTGWSPIISFSNNRDVYASWKLLEESDFNVDIVGDTVATILHKGITTLTLPPGLTPSAYDESADDQESAGETEITIPGRSADVGFKMFVGGINSSFNLSFNNPDGWDVFSDNNRTFIATRIYEGSIDPATATLSGNSPLRAIGGFNMRFEE